MIIEGVAPPPLTSVQMDFSSELYTLAALPLGKLPWFLLDRWLSGFQRVLGRSKNVLSFPRIETLYL
jgi:hypothetical protein